MSEYMFGVHHGRVPPALVRKIDRLLKGTGVYFVDNVERKSWFCVRNYGEPFNRTCERETMTMLRAAGVVLGEVDE